MKKLFLAAIGLLIVLVRNILAKNQKHTVEDIFLIL